MKVGLLISFAAFSLSCCFAQDASQKAPAQKTLSPPPRNDVKIETPQAPKTPTIDTNLLAEPNLPKKKESALNYSGFVVDVARSTNRWRMFSLRKPADRAHDGDNLMDSHSETGHSIKLFSIGFK